MIVFDLRAEIFHAAVALAVGLCAWTLYGIVFHPLRSVPGPWYARFTSLPLTIKVATGRRTEFIHTLHARYGPTVRISPREISTIDLEAIKSIYSQGSSQCIKDQVLYHPAQIDTAHVGLFSMSNKDDHARRRRLLSPAFAKNVVERHEDFIAHKIQNLVDKLKAKQGEIIDVLAMWRLFTADIVVLASLGTDLKMTESAEIHPFVSDVDSALSMSIFRSLTGSTLYNVGQWMATRLLKRSNETRRAFEARDRAINEFGAPLVNQYAVTVGHDAQSKEIISRLISGMSAKEKPLSIDDVIADGINMFIAGTDTTSTTLTYLCYRVFTNPQAYEKLHQELVEAFNNGTPSLKQLEKLPYLKQAIKETLRLHSAAPGTLPRITQDVGIMIGQHHIPAGYCVGAQAHSVHRDVAIWGSDAEEWKPERWDNVTKQQEEAFRPFSTGPTNCLGQTLAYIEATMAAAYIFRYFRGELAPGFTAADMEHRDFFLLVPASHACKLVFTPVA